MLNLLNLSWNYLINAKKEHTISTSLKICFTGITIGTFSLMLILFVMRGFEVETYTKIKSIYPQIIMENPNSFLNFDQIEKIINLEFPEIEAFSPSSMQYIILDNKNSNYDISNVIILKGIDPINEFKVNNSLKINLTENSIAIGKKISETLNIKINNKVTLLIPQQDDEIINFEKKISTISDIFNTGIDEFDNKLAFISLNLFKKLFPESGINQIGIKLKLNVNEKNLILKLKKRFNLEVYSWKDLNPGIISALILEKYAMLFILILILIIASMNIISLIFMLIIQKRRDIAILKAMGIGYKKIQAIFFITGFIITLVATILGQILALIIGKLLQHYKFIELPDVYYVSHLPIKIEFSIFVFVFFTVIIISSISILISVQKIKNLNIAQTLKFN